MNPIFIVARKEALQIIHNRQTLISAVVIAIVFSMVTLPAMIGRASEGAGPTGTSLGVYVTMLIGVFLGYLFAGQAFLREKQEGTIETLLCSPLSLRQIWLGKVVGVTSVAYAIDLVASVLIGSVASAVSGIEAFPSLPVIAYVLTVVPVVTAAAVGLLGFVQLLLGMRENQIINVVVIFLLIFLLSIAQGIAGPAFTVTWQIVGLLFALSVGLLWVISLLHRFLDREKIVLTLP